MSFPALSDAFPVSRMLANLNPDHRWKTPLSLLIAMLVLQSGIALAQASESTIDPQTLLVIKKPETGSRWTALTKEQQQILLPLAGLWESMDAPQQRKWLALTQTYPNLAVAEKDKLRGRMVEWAALSPKDRTIARLNFALTKSVDKAERAANWEAYQALPEAEKKKLAAKAPVKPAGAAIAVKPVPPQKLTAVPVTRNTPVQQRKSVVAQSSLNPNTLLPEPAPAPNLPTPENEPSAKP